MKMGLGQGKRIVVIGGSAAGAAAGARVKRLYPNAEVYLFEKGKYVSYGACELPYFLSGEISSVSQLQLYTPEQLSVEKNITVLSETEVLEIGVKQLEFLDLKTLRWEVKLMLLMLLNLKAVLLVLLMQLQV